jgi:hypothetical protein
MFPLILPLLDCCEVFLEVGEDEMEENWWYNSFGLTLAEGRGVGGRGLLYSCSYSYSYSYTCWFCSRVFLHYRDILSDITHKDDMQACFLKTRFRCRDSLL